MISVGRIGVASLTPNTHDVFKLTQPERVHGASDTHTNKTKEMDETTLLYNGRFFLSYTHTHTHIDPTNCSHLCRAKAKQVTSLNFIAASHIKKYSIEALFHNGLLF